MKEISLLPAQILHHGSLPVHLVHLLSTSMYFVSTWSSPMEHIPSPPTSVQLLAWQQCAFGIDTQLEVDTMRSHCIFAAGPEPLESWMISAYQATIHAKEKLTTLFYGPQLHHSLIYSPASQQMDACTPMSTILNHNCLRLHNTLLQFNSI